MIKDLVGNEANKQLLHRLLENGRVPNSFLFAGPEGVGKRAFALEIAKSLVCTEPSSGEACSVCPSCRRCEVFKFPKADDKDAHKLVIWSDHPDVGTVIAYKRYIFVDAIRHLESEANYRPYEARSRVFIIDDADRMNDAAANALLKTLEEPPATSYIFLITSRPDSMLATIRSRCQVLRFSPVERTQVEAFLIEQKAFSSDEARLAASVSNGSIGRALSISADDYRMQSQRMLGVIRDAIHSGNVASMLKVSEELNDAKNKDRIEENLDILESLIHDVWTLCVSGDAARIANTEFATELQALAAEARRTELPKWVDAIDAMRQSFDVNINKKVALDAIFVSMAG